MTPDPAAPSSGDPATAPAEVLALPARRVGMAAARTPDREHGWLRDVLALDVRGTLGRAAWRPQALCMAVYGFRARATSYGPTGWPTVDELAEQLDWAPGLVLRHLEIAHAAGLLSVIQARR